MRGFDLLKRLRSQFHSHTYTHMSESAASQSKPTSWRAHFLANSRHRCLTDCKQALVVPGHTHDEAAFHGHRLSKARLLLELHALPCC